MKNFIPREVWKVQERAFKNFYMVRYQFCMLQKFYTLAKQSSKSLMLQKLGLKKKIFEKKTTQFCTPFSENSAISNRDSIDILIQSILLTFGCGHLAIYLQRYSAWGQNRNRTHSAQNQPQGSSWEFEVKVEKRASPKCKKVSPSIFPMTFLLMIAPGVSTREHSSWTAVLTQRQI